MKATVVFLLLLLSFGSQADVTIIYPNNPDKLAEPVSAARQVFDNLALEGQLDFAVFEKGYQEYQRLQGDNPHLTIIDYSKPSSEKRLFIFDMQRKQLVFKTLVAHGENSGLDAATQFSNRVSSHKTSLGVFVTAETYYGTNGYSLRLDGLSPGLNDNARVRSIVVHGADYAEVAFLQRNGRLGRSWGCPAVPMHQARAIIDTIKGGSVIYAYG